jgi:DNA repair protein RecO (recombination protein O)
VLLTRQHGKQRVIAKGIKRGRKGQMLVGIDLLELGEVTFLSRAGTSDALGVLTEWKQEGSFPGLRTDLLRLYASQYAAEVTALLTEDADPHPALFDGLQDLLHALAAGESSFGSLVRFQLVLLKQVGLMPRLDRCVCCQHVVGRAQPLYVSAREGGLVCTDCEPARVEKYRVTWRALQALDAPAQAEPSASAEAFALLDYYITETLGRPPKLSSLLRHHLVPKP